MQLKLNTTEKHMAKELVIRNTITDMDRWYIVDSLELQEDDLFNQWVIADTSNCVRRGNRARLCLQKEQLASVGLNGNTTPTCTHGQTHKHLSSSSLFLSCPLFTLCFEALKISLIVFPFQSQFWNKHSFKILCRTLWTIFCLGCL